MTGEARIFGRCLSAWNFFCLDFCCVRYVGGNNWLADARENAIKGHGSILRVKCKYGQSRKKTVFPSFSLPETELEQK